MRRRNGFSLMEVVVVLALFAILLMILVSLEREMFRFDRESRVALFRHPEPLVLMSRFRRDVLDSLAYPASHEEFAQSPQVLLLSLNGGRVVVYDFSTASVAKRIEFGPGGSREEWRASAMPALTISSQEMPDGVVAVRLSGTREGLLLYETTAEPRRMMK